MQSNERTGQSRRLLASTVAGAALVAGVVAAAAPAVAAQPTAPNQGHASNAKQLPRMGARKTPFSPRTATSATTAKGVTRADAADHPWLVGISMYGNDLLPCTGTIVSPTKVVTSASCAVGEADANLAVIAGRDNLLDDSVGFVDGVASVRTDPNFQLSADGNGMGSKVQVLTLTQPLPTVYTPISLSAQGDESPYTLGGSATTYGYELNAPNGTVLSVDLVQAAVTIQAGSGCSALNKNYPAKEEVCTGFSDSSQDEPSFFDIGSPLIAGGKQIGVSDRLIDTRSTQLAFERMSVFHNDIAAELARPLPNNADWYGDGNSDVVSEGTNGQLTLFQGMGASPALNSGFVTQSTVDTYDWNTSYYKMIRVNNWDGGGVGAHGLLAVEHDGALDYYPIDAAGKVDHVNVQHVGTGWNQFGNIIPINNFAGDGNLALLAEKPDGTVRLYEHNANGWINGGGTQIGAGFNQFTSLMGLQWTDNGHVGLLGVRSDGVLMFYGVDGNGHWTDGSGQAIGSGFGGLRTVFGVGSFGGSDTGSIMTVDQAGRLKVYQANGAGRWLNGNGDQIGVGFDTTESLF